jgi:hypothetical protein
MRAMAAFVAGVVWATCGCGGSGFSSLGDQDGGGPAGPDAAAPPADATSGADGPATIGVDAAMDAPTSADAGVDAPGFNVGAVNGVVLWLATSSSTFTMTGGRITKWADQTAHHNDANGGFTQDGGPQGRDPSVNASAINGHAAVHFNQTGTNAATGQMLVVPENADGSLDWGTGDFFVVMVADFDNNPAAPSTSLSVGTLFAKTGSGSAGGPQGVSFYANVPAGNDPTNMAPPAPGLDFVTSNLAGGFATTSTSYDNSVGHVFAVRRRGLALDVLVDGASVANATSLGAANVTTAQSALTIGAQGDSNIARLDGDIAEIVAVKGALAPGDEAAIDAYLKNKYGTP